MNLNKLSMYLLLLIFILISNKSFSKEKYNNGTYLRTIKYQTKIDGAKFIISDKGIPFLDVKNLGKIEHPAYVAIYALQYGGLNSFYPKFVGKNNKKFLNCITWLEKNLKEIKTKDGKNIFVWLYKFDNIYNNVYIKSLWYSSFAQAVGIEAFIAAYQTTGNSKYLNLAEKAAKVLFIDIKEGGLLYTGKFNGKEIIWFEEIPAPADNPSHILNAHLRTLIAIYKLYKFTKKKKYLNWFNKGLDSLKTLLPLYDTGYWLKYDLNLPTKILLRFNNPYGFEIYPLAIDKIEFEDPVNKLKYKEDLGQKDDFESHKKIFLSGIDWQVESVVNNKTVRRLKKVIPSSFTQEVKSKKLQAPHTYFYVYIPFQKNNLRSDPFLLKITYRDEKRANINIQIRSIMPKIKFIDLSGGNLLLKGDGNFKTWIIPIYPNQIGWFTGKSYAEKHYLYLKKICEETNDKSICQWKNIASYYLDSIEFNKDKYKTVNSLTLKFPKQTPMLNKFSKDLQGVIRQHSSKNIPIYHPFAISLQVLLGNKYFSAERKPGLNWLIENAKCKRNFCVWTIPIDNAYNDIYTKSNWQSAFVQAYVIKALIYAYQNMGRKDVKKLIFKAVNAYKIPTAKGGLSTYSKEGYIWFEEVPNNTHILNAHLVSINALYEVCDLFSYKIACNLYNEGLKSLKKLIARYDNGYWTLYDQNPKKELLLQIDWIKGRKSPYIDEICILSPYSMKKSCIDVGSDKDSFLQNRITGIDWNSPRKEDGYSVRNFNNGYLLRKRPVKGGTRHNVYFRLLLPDRKLNDYFDIDRYYLTIRYKDIDKGRFVIKIQSNNEGNILKFVPLSKSLFLTKGDNQWKTFVIPLKNQNLGWYLGVDYHKYHISQLKNIYIKTNDLLYKQYLEMWEMYLYSFNKRIPVILEPKVKKYKKIFIFKIKN